MIGFAPWLAFFLLSSSNHPTRHTLYLACAVGFVLAIALMVSTLKKHTVSSIDIGGLVFFPIMAILTAVLPATTTDQWAPAISQAALTIAVGAGIAIGKPFTLIYAKAATPEVLWTNSYFIAFSRRLSLGWFYGFLLMTASSVAGAFFPPTSIGAIIFNWVIPTLIMVTVIRWMISEIAKRKAEAAGRTHDRLSVPIAAGDPVVSFLDHVTTRVAPAQAQPLFAALKSLGLVEAWGFKDYGDFSSGGIRLGNLNLEIIGAPAGSDIPPQFVTFEPASLAGLLPELDRRGLTHGDFDTQKYEDMELYTRIPLEQLQSRAFCGQLCATFGPTRTEMPVAPVNKAHIVEVSEVRITSSEEFLPHWRALLAPLDISRYMSFSQGPAFSLDPGEIDDVVAITVKVDDLQAATAACAKAGLAVDGTRVQVGTLTLELTPGSGTAA